jgi:NodT family efflux transporter outer membrane factor (OMF) lipoprotein
MKTSPLIPAILSFSLLLLRAAGRGGLLALLLSLWACAPVSRPVSPPASLSAHFTASGAETVADQWWSAFHDPILDDLIQRALSGNFTIRGAWDRLSQAEAQARKAGAALLPGLEGEAGAGRRRERSNGTTTSPRDTVSLGLVVAYELDLWGRVRSARDAAALDAGAAAEDLQAAAQTLAAEVADTWYQLTEEQAQLELLDRQLVALEQVLELVTLRFRRGQVGAADVLRQRQLVEANRGERALAEARAEVVEHRLAILLGLDPTERVVEPITILAALPPLPATGVPLALLQRRPDLRSAWLRVRAADQRTAAALADRFPRLGLTARIGSEGGQGANLLSTWLIDLAANLTGPVFDGGFRQAEAQLSGAEAAEALNLYGQAILVAVGEVEDALSREAHQQDFVRRLENQLVMAEQVGELVRDRYLRGNLDYLRVLDALLNRQSLERNHLTARRQLLQNRIDLYRALAGGLDLPAPTLSISTNPENPAKEGPAS